MVFVLATGTFQRYSLSMDTVNLITDLESAMKRRLAKIPARLRPFTKNISSLPRALSLTGARGVGKTTFLLNHAQNKNMLYLSADNPRIAGMALYDALKAIFLAGYSGVIVDEVHFAKDWSVHVKAIYDDFPDHLIWISDSSSLILRNGVSDLSRRFVNKEMPLLSFREFLYLETGIEYDSINPFENPLKVPVEPSPKILSAFKKYRSIGTRPFYQENNFSERLLSVLDKTLYFDIPFFLPNISDGNLRLMKAITTTLVTSTIPRLKVNSLCADWGIGSDKLYQLLEVMESVGLLRIIRFENDKKAKTVGAKLFMADPAFYPTLNGDIGTAREALVTMLCANAGWTIEASKDETKGDFVISKNNNKKIRLEVGGANKDRKGSDFVIRDDIDYPATKTIPLWMLGMMY